MAAPEIIIGTSGGNKTLTEVYVGTSGGNKLVTEVWVGTASGNKQVYASGTPADLTPNAVDWANISSGSSPAANANQTINGCNQPITISAVNSGTSLLSYSLDSGSYTSYTGPFSVDAVTGQTLNWQIAAAGVGEETGGITVINDSDSGVTLDTFTYSVVGEL
ncbi:hypothetical protein [Hyphomonas sp.]|uniref:hypothetical protein n=1 Tax=Hyphomonas sp. TaxID=87 RepID=UPI003003203D